MSSAVRIAGVSDDYDGLLDELARQHAGKGAAAQLDLRLWAVVRDGRRLDRRRSAALDGPWVVRLTQERRPSVLPCQRPATSNGLGSRDHVRGRSSARVALDSRHGLSLGAIIVRTFDWLTHLITAALGIVPRREIDSFLRRRLDDPWVFSE